MTAAAGASVGVLVPAVEGTEVPAADSEGEAVEGGEGEDGGRRKGIKSVWLGVLFLFRGVLYSLRDTLVPLDA